MAITIRDKHGTYKKSRRDDGPALDRRSTRYFAVVANTWSLGFATRREAESAEREMKNRAEHGVGLHKAAMTFVEFLRSVWLPLVETKVARTDDRVRDSESQAVRGPCPGSRVTRQKVQLI